MAKVKTLTIQFDTPLRRSELPLFRGAIIATIPSSNILFHNHDGTTLRYAYPLIQYKRIGGKAAIVCIDEGVEAVGKLLINTDFTVTIGNRSITLQIEKIEAEETKIAITESPITYHLQDWLPLNETNYAQFQSIEGIARRIRMLERILTGNILSLLKGLGIHIDFTLTPVIIDYTVHNAITYKHVRLTNMDICFTVNIMLPELIGLGKHSSIGAGILTRRKQNNQ